MTGALWLDEGQEEKRNADEQKEGSMLLMRQNCILQLMYWHEILWELIPLNFLQDKLPEL